MKKDIAIEEIRAARHRISERFGHDTKALLDHYRELEKRYKDRMVKESVTSGAKGSGAPLGAEK